MTNETRQILYRFSILCGQLCIDEHIALENPRIRQQLAEKETLEDKLINLQSILESEF
jgi:hypothetical protein